jgi:hypothetical protein
MITTAFIVIGLLMIPALSYAIVYARRVNFHRKPHSANINGSYWTTLNACRICFSNDSKLSLWKTTSGRFFVLAHPSARFPQNSDGIHTRSREDALRFVDTHCSPSEAVVVKELFFDQQPLLA